MRIVLDTNVLVSALLKPGSGPGRILRLVLQGDLQIVINEYILLEYFEVLARSKFDLEEDKIRVVLENLSSNGIRSPALAQSFHLPDPGDEPFLEAALGGKAHYLITGNKKHFPENLCKGVTIATPNEFLSALGSA